MNIRFVLAALFISTLMPLSAFADEATTTPDTIAPVITAPADQTFATTTIPAMPSLIAATATDETDPNPVITYDPQSFPLGTTTVVWTATDATGNLATTSSLVVITDATPKITFAVRDGSTLIGPVELSLPTSGTTLSLTPTGDTTAYAIPADSVLALLSTLDTATSSMEIADLQYFSSFSSFLVNCISIPSASADPECYSWTYAVNGSFPAVGMDVKTLSANDIVYVFFGSGWQVSTDKTSAETNEAITVTAQYYDASSNTYVPASAVVVGAVQFDSNFIPSEFATSTTDGNGQATLFLASEGTYDIGVQTTGYFPNVPATITAPVPTPPSSGGGGGSVVHTQISVPSALAYLASQQNADGSFSASLYSDWIALAYAASDAGEAKTKLREYLLTASPSLSNATDYERHAMALMALGINPYSETPTNYIALITGSFDGTQIGDASLDNDDIFAIFPLLHAGYSANDDIIQKTVAFIISRQAASGAWDGSIDVTAAAVQALSLVPSLPNVSAALSKAEQYLRSQQQTNGGFGNSFATSWVLQAIAALGQSPSNWTSSGLNPNDYLASLQQVDGGVDFQTTTANNRIWATSYAIPASLGKTWGSLLTSFSRPTSGSSESSAGVVLGASTSTVATTSPVLFATSTPTLASATPDTIATSTPPVPDATQATSTATTTTPIVKVIPPKKIAPPAIAATSSATTTKTSIQAAAAASADVPKIPFFSSIWRSLTSFFSRFF